MIVSNKPIKAAVKTHGVYVTLDDRSAIKDDYIEGGWVVRHGRVQPLSELSQNIREISPSGGLRGEYFSIAIESRSKKLEISTDHFGQIRLFVFIRRNTFAISDDFWSLVRLFKPGLRGLDRDAIEEWLFFVNPFEGKTFLRELEVLPAGATVSIDWSVTPVGKTVIDQWRFECRNPYHSLKEAISDMHEKLDHAFESLNSTYPGARFLVGLSGGLDSRIIPEYCRRHGMDLRSYIIGQKNPVSRSLRSRDHRNALSIASVYGLPHHELEYDVDSLNERLELEIDVLPCTESELFKIVRTELPEYDVLLNAGGHGSFPELPMEMENLDFNISQFLLRRLTRFRYLEIDDAGWKHVVPSEKLDSFRKKLFRSFDSQKKGVSLVDAYRDLHVKHLGAWCKFGAFESQLGIKPSFSIYYPFLFDVVCKTPFSMLVGRRLLNAFVREKLNWRMSWIPYQDKLPPIALRSNKIVRRIAQSGSYWSHRARGGGLGYSNWMSEEGFLRFADQELREDDSVFWDCFDREAFCRLFSRSSFAGMRATAIKQKRIIEKIVAM